ncbi:MAG TPA: NADH-quinone oxidoreductase subunit J, partial [Nitrospinota bacterium]|nr:NADH-quinone oxidoreductase subunit J [Nitrospinota bacterium]
EWPFFIIFGLGMLIASVLVITRRNVVHAALYLLLTLFCAAALYVMLEAEFLAAIQVLIYAGAIMMLYVFVIMLINVRESMAERQWQRQKAAAGIIGALLAAEFVVILLKGVWVPSAKTAEAAKAVLNAYGGNTEAFGATLYTEFLFPFEVASLLLLAAMIGAIVIAKREI